MAIVKMKKVSLVVLDAERKESLKQLRKLGLVHLEAIEGQGPKLAAYKEASNEADKAISILGEVKLPKKTVVKQVSVEGEEALSKIKEVIACSEKKKSLLDSINQDIQELSRFEGWGNVSNEDLQSLAEKNLFMYMYEIPAEKYSLIGENAKTILVNTTDKIARFLLISESEVTERPSDLPAEAYSVPLPRASTNIISKDIEEAKKQISELEAVIVEDKKYLDAIKAYRKVLDKDIEFETVYSGMEHEEEVETALAWISGYVPVDSMVEFEKCCKENQWAYACEDASIEDSAVPTKLKNNKLVSLIYPLTDFLGTVPGYNEFDISGWFLLFFTIFFGMIFGDGGYGLLVVIGVIALMIKGAVTKKGVSPLLKLALLLGISTVVWGTVTCTWFGVSAATLEHIGLGFLPKLSVPVLSSAYAEVSPGVPALFPLPWSEEGGGLTNTQCLQIFCFVLALLQLSVAHIKCIFRHRKSLKVLGEIGALLQVIGMFWVVLMIVISMKEFPMDAVKVFGVIPIGYIFVTLIAVGFALSFVFSNYEGSIKDSILASLKNIISVLLGIVNVFSDILSYVRLWAVGLAGSAISSTVNGMAAQINGVSGPVVVHAIIFLVVIALLLFGHGLNMILNLLSVIVHGVRLNTLEFSNHLSMEWSGIKYDPFDE